MRLLKFIYQLVNAASTVAWLVSVGSGTAVTAILGAILPLDSPWKYPFYFGLFLLATGLTLAQAEQRWPAAVAASGPGEDRLLRHNVLVLDSQVQALHEMFKKVRDDASMADPAEQVFQMKIEPIVKWELLHHQKLLRHFYDDAGFNQRTHGEPRQAAVTNFLERRYLRLKDVLERLEQDAE